MQISIKGFLHKRFELCTQALLEQAILQRGRVSLARVLRTWCVKVDAAAIPWRRRVSLARVSDTRGAVEADAGVTDWGVAPSAARFVLRRLFGALP
jgi:hypothetical protein